MWRGLVQCGVGAGCLTWPRHDLQCTRSEEKVMKISTLRLARPGGRVKEVPCGDYLL